MVRDLELLTNVKNAVPEVGKITDGKLDYIIANAGLVSSWSGYDPIGDLYDPLDKPSTSY